MRLQFLFYGLFAALGAAGLMSEAKAQTAEPHAYAIVVGSNAGSKGQEQLRFAESDATQVAGILTELGRYQEDQIEVLLAPRSKDLWNAIHEVAQKLDRHRARSEESVLFFYYSGHARSQAINLGADEVLLRDLREELTALPTTLTLVVLDACQSGAFSRMKGAEPAGDFSYNSVSGLNTEGVAVMASSSSDELSQESDELQASYFTHHLLVAMRGAADGDRDGRVTLEEAYRYAYNRTLADTSQTAVGGQHVSLETELTGHGAVALTYPAEANAHLTLPSSLSGSLLVQQKDGGAVMAELQKAKGHSLTLALPAGEYDVVLREKDTIQTCPVRLASGQNVELDTSSCRRVKRQSSLKGKRVLPPMEIWGFEFAGGFGGNSEDEFNARLGDFGYVTPLEFPFGENGIGGRFVVAAERYVIPNLSLMLQFNNLENRSYARPLFSNEDESFNWKTYAIAVNLRASVPVAGDVLRFYAQFGGGPAFGRTSLTDVDQNAVYTYREAHWGYNIGAAGGIQIMPWRPLGFYVQAGYVYAPVIKNNLGDTHNSGGYSVLFGLRARLWSKP